MTLAAEDRFLLALARPTLDANDAGRATAALEQGLDWDYIRDASIRHAIAPLVGNALGQLFSARPEAEQLVPFEVREEMLRLFEHNRGRSARMFATIAEVVGRFHEAGVKVLGLKDVDLAVSVYPDRALRPLGDVDLLVNRADWDAASSCLIRLGFEPQPGIDQPYADKYAVGQQFRRPSDETWVDLQWHVAEREWDRFGDGRFTFDTVGMWSRAVPLRIGDQHLLAPSPADQLIHLCLHVEGHEYCELVLFCDIVVFLERYKDSMDWDTLVERAATSGTASSVYHVLLLTHRLFDIPLPEGVMERLRPSYFRGNLNQPLYGNLGSLHHALDDLHGVGASVPQLGEEFEALVREQAARAMTVEAELDDLAETFAALGGEVLVFDGSPSTRRFPDAAIPPFGPLELFVVAEDRDRLSKAAESLGFRNSAEAGVTSKDVVVRSADPVLVGRSADFRIDLNLSTDLAAAMAAGSTPILNRRAALRSVQRHLRRASGEDAVQLTVYALSKADILLCLATRLGRRSDGQLFGACSALHLLGRDHVSSIDVPALARLARRHGVADVAGLGMAILQGIWGADVVPSMPAGFPDPPARVLTWARYGPTSLERHPELRSAYLWTLCLMVSGRASTRLSFLRRSVLGGAGVAPLLPPILSGVVTGTLGRLRREQPTANELAYWARPSPSESSAA